MECSKKMATGFLSTAWIALFIAANSPPAVGQPEKDVTDATSLEEVVVTAMRRNQSLREVPQSVQVFDGDRIEFQGITDLDTALQLVPGANQGFATTPGTTEYNFRGTGAQGALGDMAVGFYIDDVPYYTPDNPYAPAIRFFDLQSVQVLRGPQGTLYGQGSMGGTIIVKTEDPLLDSFAARTRLRAADLEDGEASYGVDATVSVPLIRDKLALRVTGGWERTPGLAEGPEFPGEDNIDSGDIRDIRAKLLFRPNERLSLLATYWETNDEGDFTYTYFDNDPATLITGGVRGERDNETRLASLVVDLETSFGLLKSSTSLNEYRDTTLFGVAVNLPPPAAFIVDLDATSESFNQELTLTSTSDGPWQWIVGATYTDADRSTDFAQNLRLLEPPISLFSAATVTQTKTEQYAVFGEVSRAFMDGLLTPLIGLRYYRDDREFTDSAVDGSNVSAYDETFDALSPRFNLLVSPSDNYQFFFNVAKGFRSGNFNIQSFVDLAAQLGVESNAANPEAEVWSYEVGARASALNGRLLIEPTVYLADYSDYQFAGTVGGALVSLSLAEVQSTGVDLVLSYQSSIEGLSFSLAGNWNQTEPGNLTAAQQGTVASLAEDEQLPYIPEYSVNAGADYRWQLGNGVEAFAFAAVTHADGMLGNANVKSRDITDVSARLGVSRDRWSLSLYGNNLLDQRRPRAIRSPTTQTRRDTRQLGVELTYRFD